MRLNLKRDLKVGSNQITINLWQSYLENRTIENRNLLVEANAGLIWKQIIKLGIRDAELKEDLVNVATIKLIELIEKFQPDKGVSFYGYTEQHLRGAILGHLKVLRRRKRKEVPLNEERIINGNGINGTEDDLSWNDVDLSKLISQLNEREKLLLQSMMKEISNEELIRIFGLQYRTVVRIKRELITKIKRMIHRVYSCGSPD